MVTIFKNEYTFVQRGGELEAHENVQNTRLPPGKAVKAGRTDKEKLSGSVVNICIQLYY